MLPANNMFDRVVNLTFYSDAGIKVAEIKAPSYGPKPDVTIKGTLVSTDIGIATEITVTNFSAEHAIDACAYVLAQFGYNGMALQGMRAMMFSIMWADDSKQPPDRQVTFHCVGVGQDMACLSKVYKPKTDDSKDSKEPPMVPISQLLSVWISAYNAEIKKSAMCGAVRDKMTLKSAVKLMVDPTAWANVQVADSATDHAVTFYQYLQYLNDALSQQITTSEGSVIAANMLIVMDENEIKVVPTQYYTGSVPGIALPIKITHAYAASRNGPVVTLRIPFRSDITAGTVLYVDGDMIMGRSVAGKNIKSLIGIGTDVKVIVNPGIQYEFGSVTGQNFMLIQGIMKST